MPLTIQFNSCDDVLFFVIFMCLLCSSFRSQIQSISMNDRQPKRDTIILTVRTNPLNQQLIFLMLQVKEENLCK